MKYLEPATRIMRFMAKAELYKDSAAYMSAPSLVQSVVDGKVDMQKMKDMFANKGIIDTQTFDSAIVELEGLGFLLDGAITAQGIAKFTDIETARLTDLSTIQATEKGKDVASKDPTAYATLNTKEY